MTTLTRPDCDHPGDGNCAVCHGKGKVLADELPGTVVVFGYEASCSACGGSGECQICGGMGEIEVGR